MVLTLRAGFAVRVRSYARSRATFSRREKERPALSHAALSGLHLRMPRRDRPQRQDHRERAALIPLALGADLPAQQTRQPAADRQTQAGALVVARQPAVDLLEWPE